MREGPSVEVLDAVSCCEEVVRYDRRCKYRHCCQFHDQSASLYFLCAHQVASGGGLCESVMQLRVKVTSTCAWYRIAGMAMLPTAENPVKNLPASIHLHTQNPANVTPTAEREQPVDGSSLPYPLAKSLP